MFWWWFDEDCFRAYLGCAPLDRPGLIPSASGVDLSVVSTDFVVTDMASDAGQGGKRSSRLFYFYFIVTGFGGVCLGVGLQGADVFIKGTAPTKTPRTWK